MLLLLFVAVIPMGCHSYGTDVVPLRGGVRWLLRNYEMTL